MSIIQKPQQDPVIDWFLSQCHLHKYPKKSTIIHRGDVADTLYYIIDGSVAVLIKDEQGKEMILSYLSKGDFVGELALFEDEPERTACGRYGRELAVMRMPEAAVDKDNGTKAAKNQVRRPRKLSVVQSIPQTEAVEGFAHLEFRSRIALTDT